MALAGACAAVGSGGPRVCAAGTERTPAAGEPPRRRARGCALVEPVAGPTEAALALWKPMEQLALRAAAVTRSRQSAVARNVAGAAEPGAPARRSLAFPVPRPPTR